MSQERHLLESAIQTLRGQIADYSGNREKSAANGGYYMGHTYSAWYQAGMEAALKTLESIVYEAMQSHYETQGV